MRRSAAQHSRSFRRARQRKPDCRAAEIIRTVERAARKLKFAAAPAELHEIYQDLYVFIIGVFEHRIERTFYGISLL